MGRDIERDIHRQQVSVEADSCSQGMGVSWGTDWYYADWSVEAPDIHAMHINHKEATTIVLAARRWGPFWEGTHVAVRTDNKTAMHIINRGTSANPVMMSLIRELFWLSIYYNFSITAVYIKGEHNLFADTISRLGSNGWLLQWALLNQVRLNHPDLDMFVDNLHHHMPYNSVLTLLPQIRQLGAWRDN